MIGNALEVGFEGCEGVTTIYYKQVKAGGVIFVKYGGVEIFSLSKVI